VVAVRLVADVLEVSAVRSVEALRCGGRGMGPDKSGNSLAYASAGGPSARAGAASNSCVSLTPRAVVPGPAVPDMKRFSRSSMPPGGVDGLDSVDDSEPGRRGLDVPREAPRCHGGESPVSEVRPVGPDVARCAPDRSAEPSPF
jgi:hypothetical protein